MKKSRQAPCLHSKISGAIEIPLAVDHRVSRLPQRLSANGLRLTIRFWHNRCSRRAHHSECAHRRRLLSRKSVKLPIFDIGDPG